MSSAPCRQQVSLNLQNEVEKEGHSMAAEDAAAKPLKPGPYPEGAGLSIASLAQERSSPISCSSVSRDFSAKV